MSVTIAGVTFKNPVLTASGTFGSGLEYAEFIDLAGLGGIVTKGVSNVPWPGNPTPRVAEVARESHAPRGGGQCRHAQRNRTAEPRHGSLY